MVLRFVGRGRAAVGISIQHLLNVFDVVFLSLSKNVRGSGVVHPRDSSMQCKWVQHGGSQLYTEHLIVVKD